MQQNMIRTEGMPVRNNYFALPIIQSKKKKDCCKKFKKGKRCKSCPGRKKD
ncbi:MAG: hypothetical protein UZ08_BCD001001506 [Candidatus Parvibacillus calidus]|jgi:hypothetical protein|nr:MAG: hypothetical protein UZ08_BCD001001506 [Candidatus Parvibacillus calidus]